MADRIPVPESPLTRAASAALPATDATPSFLITAANRSYKHQYANIYFLRLHALRKFVEERARCRWRNIDGNPRHIPRVLEVEKGKLCYIIGTVYMEMPLKPNVLEDIARDRSIPPPPLPRKFYSDDDCVMLEDESGRVSLVGARLKRVPLVTGVVIGVLGVETANGDFEVADVCFPGMAPQQSRAGDADDFGMSVDEAPGDEWVALVSGLDVGGSSLDVLNQLLVEYLTGEAGGPSDQLSATRIARLIILGNSIAPVDLSARAESLHIDEKKKRSRRHGRGPANFSLHPIQTFSAHLHDIAQAMPVHILPGPTDPSGTILPQQPFPRTMMGPAASYPSFYCETNPTYLRLGTGPEGTGAPSAGGPSVARTFLVHSGQPVDDMLKYLPSPPHTPLSLLESTLKWRHMAPTAPDTLWCHPYFAVDPFMLKETPDVYVAGGQKQFGTRLVEEDPDDENGDGGKRCRLIAVPNFAECGILVLVNLRSLDVKTVKIGVRGMMLVNGAEPEPPQEEEEEVSATAFPQSSQMGSESSSPRD